MLPLSYLYARSACSYSFSDPVPTKNRAQPKAGKIVMFKHLITLVLVALAAACVSPAGAQTPGTSVGALSCRMAPSIGLIFGSQQRMACRFQPNGPYPPEAYVGVMNTIGLDVGITAGGVMGWGVFAPTAGPMYGGLAGTYVGASGSIGVGVGGAPISCSVERDVRSPCNRYRSRGRSGSTSLLEFQV